jgi:hypothetical protein
MHLQMAGVPQPTPPFWPPESVDFAAVSLPQARLRLLTMMAGNPLAAVACAIGVIDAACPALREE